MSYISTAPEPEVMLCTASCPLVSEFGKHNFGDGRQWAVDFNSCESLLPVTIRAPGLDLQCGLNLFLE